MLHQGSFQLLISGDVIIKAFSGHHCSFPCVCAFQGQTDTYELPQTNKALCDSECHETCQ